MALHFSFSSSHKFVSFKKLKNCKIQICIKSPKVDSRQHVYQQYILLTQILILGHSHYFFCLFLSLKHPLNRQKVPNDWLRIVVPGVGSDHTSKCPIITAICLIKIQNLPNSQKPEQVCSNFCLMQIKPSLKLPKTLSAKK